MATLREGIGERKARRGPWLEMVLETVDPAGIRNCNSPKYWTFSSDARESTLPWGLLPALERALNAL